MLGVETARMASCPRGLVHGDGKLGGYVLLSGEFQQFDPQRFTPARKGVIH